MLIGDDGWPRLKITRSSAFVKLQILPKRNDCNVGTKEANFLYAVPHRAALIDGAEDHPLARLDGSPPGVVPAENVNEVGVLRKGFGKALAVGGVPRRFEVVSLRGRTIRTPQG